MELNSERVDFGLMNRIEKCTGCGTQGIVGLRFLHYDDLPNYLKGIFDRWWICLECVSREKEKYALIRSRVNGAKRRAILNHAMPKWADRTAIKAVYAEAVRISRETGIPHEVDHIFPLNAPDGNGLHVHWNLQIIPAVDNRKKSNRLDDSTIAKRSAPIAISGYDQKESPEVRAFIERRQKQKEAPRLVKIRKQDGRVIVTGKDLRH